MDESETQQLCLTERQTDRKYNKDKHGKFRFAEREKTKTLRWTNRKRKQILKKDWKARGPLWWRSGVRVVSL